MRDPWADGPQRFIVAEVSKNWHAGKSPSVLLLSQLFEALIQRNLERGYLLHSFELHRVYMPPDDLNETIIAVFEWVGPPDLATLTSRPA